MGQSSEVAVPWGGEGEEAIGSQGQNGCAEVGRDRERLCSSVREGGVNVKRTRNLVSRGRRRACGAPRTPGRPRPAPRAYSPEPTLHPAVRVLCSAPSGPTRPGGEKGVALPLKHPKVHLASRTQILLRPPALSLPPSATKWQSQVLLRQGAESAGQRVSRTERRRALF